MSPPFLKEERAPKRKAPTPTTETRPAFKHPSLAKSPTATKPIIVGGRFRVVSTFDLQTAGPTTETGITSDSRKPVHFVDDIDCAYLIQRYRETHDLVHALLDMPTNMLGEVAVKWVEALQTRLPMCIGAALMGPLRLKPKQREKYRSLYLPWAIRCGLEAKSLLCVYYEKRWTQPVDDLRRELGIPSLPK